MQCQAKHYQKYKNKSKAYNCIPTHETEMAEHAII